MLPWADLWTPPAFGAQGSFLITWKITSDVTTASRTPCFQVFCLYVGPFISVKHHAPVNFGRVQSSWSGTGDPLDRLWVREGLPGHCISLSNLFFSIPLVNFHLNANWDSAGNLLARAREFNVLTFETEQRKVNWRWGHHLVFQTSSKPIVLCLLVLTSSTQCFEWLWREMGSV